MPEEGLPTFADLFEVNLKQLDFLVEKTRTLHAYLKSIGEAGAEVEAELRNLFARLLPSRFRVTHGYVARSRGSSAPPIVSPQLDLIVVDTLVPHSLFLVDMASGMEVVPLPAVVGLLEIKRTLNRGSLLGTTKRPGALRHLKRACDVLEIDKQDDRTFLPGGIELGNSLGGGYHANPLVGVLALEHAPGAFRPRTSGLQGTLVSSVRTAMEQGLWPPVDLIASFGGLLFTPVSVGPKTTPAVLNPRPNEEDVTYSGMVVGHRERSRQFVVARILGYVLTYLSQTTGRNSDIQDFFFHDPPG